MRRFVIAFLFPFTVLLLVVALALADEPPAAPKAKEGLQDARQPGRFRLASFEADITVPVGHGLMGGGIAPAKEIVDPLFARGLVLSGVRQLADARQSGSKLTPSSADKPIVICALDWCQLNNDAYDRWRDRLAEAAGTSRERVLLACVHQHDAPIYDTAAQKMLDAHGLPGAMCDLAFMERALNRVARTVGELTRESEQRFRPVTHVGVGEAEVKEIASNRRVESADGKVSWPRNSATRDAVVAAAPVGIIDPMLKTISFWEGQTPVAAISCYAVHPMSYYGRGGVSADFPGIARTRRQQDDPAIFQIYFTGCAGDTTAGKYNDGSPDNRPVLADKLYQAMAAAWKATRRVPLERIEIRVAKMPLEARDTGDYEPARLRAVLADASAPRWPRILAAFGLSWQERVAAGRPIDVPVLDLGPAQFMLMPGETFVQYQLIAQRLSPDSLVMVAAFADGAPGYIPDDRNAADGYNVSDWCWVDPGVEKVMVQVMRQALTGSSSE